MRLKVGTFRDEQRRPGRIVTVVSEILALLVL